MGEEKKNKSLPLPKGRKNTWGIVSLISILLIVLLSIVLHFSPIGFDPIIIFPTGIFPLVSGIIARSKKEKKLFSLIGIIIGSILLLYPFIAGLIIMIGIFFQG